MSMNLPGEKSFQDDPKLGKVAPGQLALFAGNFLKHSTRYAGGRDLFILDLGCGNGRDAIYLARNLACHILALDSSPRAIELARAALPHDLEKRVELLCYDIRHVSDKYDIIFVSDLYHLLGTTQRAELRDTVRRCLKSEGLVFLNTLSIRDPQHFGQGFPVEGEINSFLDHHYCHFSTRGELERDFAFLSISALFEMEYREPLAEGSHHHVTWILMGSPGLAI
jgi:SAM-dependent methyltransferase